MGLKIRLSTFVWRILIFWISSFKIIKFTCISRKFIEAAHLLAKFNFVRMKILNRLFSFVVGWMGCLIYCNVFFIYLMKVFIFYQKNMIKPCSQMFCPLCEDRNHSKYARTSMITVWLIWQNLYKKISRILGWIHRSFIVELSYFNYFYVLL